MGLTAYQFTCTTILGSLAYFTPTLVTGLGFESVQANLMTVPPWAIGYVFSIAVAWSSDRFNERGLHVAACGGIAGIGFLTSALLPPTAYMSRYGCLLLVACGAFPAASPLVGWVTSNAPSGRTVGLAAAINNATVGAASVLSVWIWRSDEAERGYPTGLIVCCVCAFVTAALSLGLRFHYGKMNRNRVVDINGVAREWVL